MSIHEYQVTVTIHQARRLATGPDKSSNVLCFAEIGPLSRRRQNTSVKWKTSSAVWETCLFFDKMYLTGEQFANEKLQLKVFHQNDFTANDLIGSTEFALVNIRRQPKHSYHGLWLALTLPSDHSQVQGYLRVSVTALMDSEEKGGSEQQEEEDQKEVLREPETLLSPTYHTLNCSIFRAEHLVVNSSLGLNLFVAVRFNGNVSKTGVVKESREPVWNRRLELPFSSPVLSELISISIWNRLSGLPNCLVAEWSLNLLDEKNLLYRTFGPRWVCLYTDSAAPSWDVWRAVKDGLTADPFQPKFNELGHEYVGRVLLQIESATVESPRLQNLHTSPLPEPLSAKHFVHFFGYQVANAGVSDGELALEVCFGASRSRKSAWRRKRNGIYDFSKAEFEVLKYHSPLDTEQGPAVLINLYHKDWGGGVRKVAFLSLPLVLLLPGDAATAFHVNSEPCLEKSLCVSIDPNIEARATQRAEAYHPLWRNMVSLLDPPVRSCALLSTVAVGRGDYGSLPSRPEVQLSSYTLKAFIVQAANLVPVDGSGMVRASVEVRLGHKGKSTPAQMSLYPFYMNEIVLENMSLFEPLPPILITVHHLYRSSGITGGSKVALGSCQVTPSCLKRPGKLWRFRLRKGQEEAGYVLAALSLEKNIEEKKASKNPSQQKKPKQREGQSIWHEYRNVAFYTYTLRFDNLGSRVVGANNEVYFVEAFVPNIENLWAETLSNDMRSNKEDYPENTYYFLDFEQETINNNTDKYERRKSVASKQRRKSISRNMIHSVAHLEVQLPSIHPQGVPLVIRAKSASSGEVLHCFAPLTSFLANGQQSTTTGGYEMHRDAPWFRSSTDSNVDKNAGLEADIDQEEETAALVPAVAPSALRESMYNMIITVFEEEPDEKRAMDSKQHIVVRDLLMGPERPQMLPEDIKALTLRARKKLSSKLPSTFHLSVKSANGSYNWIAATKGYVTCLGFVRLVKSNGNIEMSNACRYLLNLYNHGFVCRVYLVRASELRAVSGASVTLRYGKHQVHHTDSGPPEESAPNFARVFDCAMQFPFNNCIEIQVWDDGQVLGSGVLDIEHKLLQAVLSASSSFESPPSSLMVKGEEEDVAIFLPSSLSSKGNVRLRVDIMAEELARKVQADDIASEEQEAYEFRAVIWHTEGVSDGGNDIDAKICVSVNFDGKKDREQWTDVAWSSGGGVVEWNYRFVFPVEIPCKFPQFKVSLWNDQTQRSQVSGERRSLGDVELNLSSLFARRSKQGMGEAEVSREAAWFKFDRQAKGSVLLEMSLVTALLAQKKPVGKGQEEPNHSPYLPPPFRQPPPWKHGTRMSQAIKKWRYLIGGIGLALCLVPVVLVIGPLAEQVILDGNPS